MKPPPPRLPARGSVTASAKPTATAASTALPPSLSTSRPTREAAASWRDHHAMRRDDRPGGGEIGDERRGVGAGDRRSKEKREGEAERSQGSFLRIGE